MSRNEDLAQNSEDPNTECEHWMRRGERGRGARVKERKVSG